MVVADLATAGPSLTRSGTSIEGWREEGVVVGGREGGREGGRRWIESRHARAGMHARRIETSGYGDEGEGRGMVETRSVVGGGEGGGWGWRRWESRS